MPPSGMKTPNRGPNDAVTDAGLKHPAPLKNLNTLQVSGTAVTDAGVAELRKSLPTCNIFR